MPDGWVRSVATDPSNNGFFGSAPMIGLTAGQTVLRSWWNIELFFLGADITSYPPGASILRAGVVYAEAGLPPLDTPTPITNADADWLYVTTINPRIVQLSRAVNVAWQLNWGFPEDISLKSQRRNDGPGNRALYVSWEMALFEETPGFTMSGWTTSMDSYVRTPPS